MERRYDADIFVGIVTQVRSVIAGVGGIILALAGLFLSLAAPSGPGSSQSTSAQTTASGIGGLLFVLGLVLVGYSWFLYTIANRIKSGDADAIRILAVLEGIGVLCGLFLATRSASGAIGLLLAMGTFAYCLARMNGMGPRPL